MRCYCRILSLIALTLIFRQPAESRTKDKFINSNNRLALKMQDISPHDNFIWSPFGLTEVLFMIYGGTTGSSRATLRKTLRYNYQQSMLTYLKLRRYLTRDSILQSHNLLLCQKGYKVKKNYEFTIKNKHNASIAYVDFGKKQTKKLIDKWIRKRTDNKLNYPFEHDVDPKTKAIFINVIAFTDQWMNEFSKSYRKIAFKNFNKKRTLVPSMKLTSDILSYKDRFAQVIAIPYKNSEINFLIFMPSINIAKFEKHLAKRNIFDNYVSNLESKWMEIFLPKFQVESSEDLSAALMERGYEELFRNKLSMYKMFEDGEFQLTNLMHKAAFEINENGSSAWAASFATLKWRSGNYPTRKLRIDRPFVYFLYDTYKKLILFSGHIVNL